MCVCVRVLHPAEIPSKQHGTERGPRKAKTAHNVVFWFLQILLLEHNCPPPLPKLPPLPSPSLCAWDLARGTESRRCRRNRPLRGASPFGQKNPWVLRHIARDLLKASGSAAYLRSSQQANKAWHGSASIASDML